MKKMKKMKKFIHFFFSFAPFKSKTRFSGLRYYKNLISALLIDTSDFVNVSDLENRDLLFKGGKPDKNKENEKVCQIKISIQIGVEPFEFFPQIHR